MRRIFLATPAPPEVSTYLQKLREANPNNSGIKWTKDFNLHLTVYFIGNIGSENFDRVVKSIIPIINSQKVFTLEFEKIVFAPTKKPKMIWAKFHKHGSFTQLSNAIHESLSTLIPENKFYYKEPVPHITLARFNTVKHLDNFTMSGQPGFASIQITSCELWESIATPNGVCYENVTSFQLQ